MKNSRECANACPLHIGAFADGDVCERLGRAKTHDGDNEPRHPANIAAPARSRVTLLDERERPACFAAELIESVRAPIGVAKAQAGAEGRDD